ncbi:MAG: hypothetical protein ACLP2P_02175 [Desulfobaccales bacterium]
MKRLGVIIFNFFILIVPSTLLWAGEGLDVPEHLGKKIDISNLSGINYFFAHWYNDNLWVYAFIVTILMGLLGLAIALVTDVILKMIGMEVHKIEHHE